MLHARAYFYGHCAECCCHCPHAMQVETKATKLGCGGSAAVKDAAPCAPVAALGDWTKNLAALRDEFEQAKPFEHVTIPNFFSEEYARHLLSKFPDPKGPQLRLEVLQQPHRDQVQPKRV